MFLIYMFHGFRMFEKATIRVMFYYYLKLALSSNEDKQVYQPLLATLIYEQFANINLLYTVSDYRRYCYDLIRVGSKFSEFKLPHHNMRCLQITSNIYQNTFPII